MSLQNILIAGEWRPASAASTFQAENPSAKSPLPDEYPVSAWADCDAALESASQAFRELLGTPPEKIADFLDAFAANIEARKDELVEMANLETALPVSPRLADVELPRTTNQLRQAAEAAREGSWAMPTIDSQAGIRSVYGAIGPVCVFGPNNFPFAFNSAAGGDFAAAIAAGNPVIAKANLLASRHDADFRRRGAQSRANLRIAGRHGSVDLPHEPRRRRKNWSATRESARPATPAAAAPV